MSTSLVQAKHHNGGGESRRTPWDLQCQIVFEYMVLLGIACIVKIYR